jgi:hypothetical protein
VRREWYLAACHSATWRRSLEKAPHGGGLQMTLTSDEEARRRCCRVESSRNLASVTCSSAVTQAGFSALEHFHRINSLEVEGAAAGVDAVRRQLPVHSVLRAPSM